MADAQLLALEAAARTDVGVVRRGLGLPDEDTVLDARFRDTRDPWGVRAIFGVADGLGHTKGGKVASAQTVNMLEEGIEHFARRGESMIPGVAGIDAFLRYVVERIDHTLRQSSENNVTVSGMGTTLTAAVIDGNTARILHAGDSRAYLLHAADKALRQVTPDEAVDSDQGPIPTNGIGCVADGVFVNLIVEPLSEGDVLLLCSDGLWREVTDDLIRRILVGSPSAAAAVDRLIRAANQAGGRGNIGVVVVHIGNTAITNDAGLDRLFPLAGAMPPGRAPDPSSTPMPLPGARQVTGDVSEPVPARAPYPMPGDEEQAQDDSPALRADARVEGLSAAGVTPHAQAPVPNGPPGARVVGGGDPRRIAPPPRPPGAPETSPFMAGIAGLIIGAFLIGLVWFVVARRSPRQVEVAGPPPALESAPVTVWHKTATGLYSSKVEYRKYTESGEETWVALQDDDPTEVGMVTEGGDAALYLRVSPTYDSRAGRVRATQFAIKIGQTGLPAAATGDSATGARRARGVVRVQTNQDGVIHIRKAGEQAPLNRQSTLWDSSASAYVVEFSGLDLGEYTVGHGVLLTEQAVLLTEAQPERVVRLNAPE